MAISRKSKVITIIILVLMLVLTLFVYFRFFFVYSTGVDAGDLNYFQRQGIVFKTNEGKLIQSGFKSTGNASKLQSNELKFSVTDKAVADTLMRCSGKHVELQWKRYLGTLPWRGSSQYIVDSVLSVR